VGWDDVAWHGLIAASGIVIPIDLARVDTTAAAWRAGVHTTTATWRAGFHIAAAGWGGRDSRHRISHKQSEFMDYATFICIWTFLTCMCVSCVWILWTCMDLYGHVTWMWTRMMIFELLLMIMNCL
jgi:hypothetical protein